MKRHFPPLNALRSFEATARLLSFQQAATELNVTHSAVSHQIKKLEQDLGTSLFSRLGRSIALTPVGELYYVEIHAALLQIEHSTLELFGEPDKGDLIVQAYMGVASRWLVPRVGGFRQQYPGIQIQLNNSYLGWGIDRDAVDVGIIYAEQVDNSLSYQRLFKGNLIPVCSPDLFAAEGCQSLDQLLAQPFLNITESPNNLPHWLTAHQRPDDSITIASEHDNHLLALEAAITGAGVAVMPVFFCCSDIASGKLIVPQPLPVPEIGDWYLVQQNANVANSRAICFSNWLLRELSQDAVLQQYL
ncbi:LysR substrate-binding domain-containing protein [Amphritea sp.]|uniref:LysR substrate-binding domain-containing protein n=1 Tax=Amphritea sp. TaxID=1872502 RepID=UPI003A9473C6